MITALPLAPALHSRKPLLLRQLFGDSSPSAQRHYQDVVRVPAHFMALREYSHARMTAHGNSSTTRSPALAATPITRCMASSSRVGRRLRAPGTGPNTAPAGIAWPRSARSIPHARASIARDDGHLRRVPEYRANPRRTVCAAAACQIVSPPASARVSFAKARGEEPFAIAEAGAAWQVTDVVREPGRRYESASRPI